LKTASTLAVSPIGQLSGFNVFGYDRACGYSGVIADNNIWKDDRSGSDRNLKSNVCALSPLAMARRVLIVAENHAWADKGVACDCYPFWDERSRLDGTVVANDRRADLDKGTDTAPLSNPGPIDVDELRLVDDRALADI
jgi:hypothetical protein